jgi:MHS family proline/betaine transporter-like MFS transporter
MLSGTLTFGRAVVPRDVRKAVTGASIGNAVEWSDFAIYGFLATFIAANFFPSGNETAALLNTFAIFAAAFVCAHLAGSCSGPSATGSGGNECSLWSSC